MRYIIFGTGKYCLKYVGNINPAKILCFIDNDEAKKGKSFRGKVIYSTERLLQENYDYVIVLVKNYSVIVDQLIKMNIPEEKIITYSTLCHLESIPQRLIAINNEKCVCDWIDNKSGRKVFICSHDFARTGVPVALMNLSILLKKMGYHVLLAALGRGSLEKELVENEIDYISDIEGQYLSSDFTEQLKRFDLIILGTLAIAEVGESFSRLGIPIMWWMHESATEYFEKHRLPMNPGNLYYYGVGERVLKKFSEYYPEESIKELLYFLPDIPNVLHNYSEQRSFALIGSFCERKAQDILIAAIRELSDDVREKCIFYFVGVSTNDERKIIESICKRYNQVHYIYELSQNEMTDFYLGIDVLICPSRDDPMPIVVTQALQNGVPCIISNEVGQCKYLNQIGGGAVFPSEDITALKQEITKLVMCTTEELEQYAQSARRVFELYFSEVLMRHNINKIIKELLLP